MHFLRKKRYVQKKIFPRQKKKIIILFLPLLESIPGFATTPLVCFSFDSLACLVSLIRILFELVHHWLFVGFVLVRVICGFFVFTVNCGRG